MERVTGGAALPQHCRGGVVALGNFDGFHRGHQAVVGRALATARKRKVPALVASFDPHPARLFRPDLPPFALTRICQRLDLFAAFGLDAAVVIPFDRALASLSAEEFVSEWLIKGLGVTGVVTGEDFSFGRGRSGNAEELAALGRAHGFSAEVVSPIVDSEGTISSSRVRALLSIGDPVEATALLSRPFAVRAVVEHGAKFGRTLGFPTANMRLGDYQRPAYGVYAVVAVLPGGQRVKGVANFGIRPMVEAAPEELLETWLMDWEGDLYGQQITVEFHHFLRPEWKLSSFDALIHQITADAEAARKLLGA
jgi:riboflavin kinase/FMN adenylyltransferase